MRANPAATAIAAWLLPGGGHFVVGEMRKALVFLIVLGGMYAIGLGFGGQMFAFDTSEPLVFLAAITEWAMALPRLLTSAFGGGRGDVVAVTYEYGNTFLIVSGLLNMLVVLDALDVARGVKRS
jgi:hypothetical protein